MEFIISHTDEILVSHSGLALAGAILQQSSLRKRLNEISLGQRKRPEVSHGDVLTTMIGLLCLGKSDYADIEAFRQEQFFRRALGLRQLPSEETLRQRMDQLGTTPISILHEESARLIARHAPVLTPCHGEWIPLDADVSPFDNSGTKKEGVALTYKKLDGYAPNFAYLGNEGYLLHCELRPGNQHCQEGTPEFLDKAIELARQITDGKLLVRMDAGNDAGENLLRFAEKEGCGLDHQAESASRIGGGLAGGSSVPRRLRRASGREGGLDRRDVEGARRQVVSCGVRGYRANDRG